jgi:acylglycerol lipase
LHKPSHEPIGVIFLFHGLNSHVGQAAHLAHYFGERGFYTLGFDHRGFGRSEGDPGYIHSFEAHLKDSKDFLSEVMPKYNKLPKFILGQSLGGMTVYHLTLQHPELFDGVILMAPALKTPFGTLSVTASYLISKILPKKMKLPVKFSGDSSRNPTVTEAAIED